MLKFTIVFIVPAELVDWGYLKIKTSDLHKTCHLQVATTLLYASETRTSVQQASQSTGNKKILQIHNEEEMMRHKESCYILCDYVGRSWFWWWPRKTPEGSSKKSRSRIPKGERNRKCGWSGITGKVNNGMGKGRAGILCVNFLVLCLTYVLKSHSQEALAQSPSGDFVNLFQFHRKMGILELRPDI